MDHLSTWRKVSSICYRDLSLFFWSASGMAEAISEGVLIFVDDSVQDRIKI